MELTRRDATIALAAVGISSLAIGTHQFRGDQASDSSMTDAEKETIHSTLIAIADVVYPTTVTGIPTFVATYLDGRLSHVEHPQEMIATVNELNSLAMTWHDNTVPELSRGTREQLLRETGAAAAAENPTGTTAERIRYFVVNELLFALYASPTGGELVGIENPIGHPGGIQSYQSPSMNHD